MVCATCGNKGHWSGFCPEAREKNNSNYDDESSQEEVEASGRRISEQHGSARIKRCTKCKSIEHMSYQCKA
jgi:hypothetical protein